MYVSIAATCLISCVHAQAKWARLHPHFWRKVQRRAGEMLLLATCFAGRVLCAFRGSGRGGRSLDRLLRGGGSFKGAAAVL